MTRLGYLGLESHLIAISFLFYYRRAHLQRTESTVFSLHIGCSALLHFYSDERVLFVFFWKYVFCI